MNTTFKILLLLFTSAVLCTQCENEPDPEIELVYIADYAFHDALIQLGVDTDGDGRICTCETAEVTSLDVSNLDIADMAGIEYFVNLVTLNCAGNQISRLDLSNNTALTDIDCEKNLLSSLDLSQNIHLGENMWESIPDISLDSMSSLYEVCVWEMPFPPEGVEIEITDSPKLFFTVDCSL